jgi:hypothetical protein
VRNRTVLQERAVVHERLRLVAGFVRDERAFILA